MEAAATIAGGKGSSDGRVLLEEFVCGVGRGYLLKMAGHDERK
jgi:hypothetical protein